MENILLSTPAFLRPAEMFWTYAAMPLGMLSGGQQGLKYATLEIFGVARVTLRSYTGHWILIVTRCHCAYGSDG